MDYHRAITQVIKTVQQDVPEFIFKNVNCIAIDFELALSNALRMILGEDSSKILQGCEVN